MIKRKVYKQTGQETEEMCNLGCKHRVTTWLTKELLRTEETHTWDTGYGLVTEPIWIDHQKRKYEQHTPIDYFGTPSFRRVEDDVVMLGRPIKTSVCKDLYGNII